MKPTIVLAESDLERLETLIARQTTRTPAIDALEAEIARAEIVDATALPPNVVSMGSTARFRDQATGQEHAYTLVYPHEADIVAGRISVLAPAGSALLGLAVGQTIDWAAPDGRVLHLEVLAVSHG
ncbi:nucleoside diphosphate kinase regulator [Chitiniphilus eburneus]|uniref:Nucleoside diphosphate kinase regulator n=1 Tax=Chitiniphilus eburneus TaxID=2571148 RepID=A0A4U0PJ52_9NEIS|nr:nucleoside diphosphate kinase regulator [Chitiniphilus eburneus]TJZ67760.1 nucleoside diphosphate kinase regulator [Chitiniphilus eburneus]